MADLIDKYCAMHIQCVSFKWIADEITVLYFANLQKLSQPAFGHIGDVLCISTMCVRIRFLLR